MEGKNMLEGRTGPRRANRMAAFLRDMINSELEMCSYNLAGGAKATREQRDACEQALKARVADLRGVDEAQKRREEIIAKCAATRRNE